MNTFEEKYSQYINVITQYNHTKLIIPFYDEEKLNTAYTTIGTAIGSNKFK